MGHPAVISFTCTFSVDTFFLTSASTGPSLNTAIGDNSSGLVARLCPRRTAPSRAHFCCAQHLHVDMSGACETPNLWRHDAASLFFRSHQIPSAFRNLVRFTTIVIAVLGLNTDTELIQQVVRANPRTTALVETGRALQQMAHISSLPI